MNVGALAQEVILVMAAHVILTSATTRRIVQEMDTGAMRTLALAKVFHKCTPLFMLLRIKLCPLL